MSTRNRRRRPKPATPEILAKAAESYVARFQATEAMLRDVLMRRLARTERLFDSGDWDRDAALSAVDDLCARYARAGLVDDAAFAWARARSMFERGVAPRQIRRRLVLKGVAEDVADGAVEALAETGADAELQACARLARRRRLGPFSTRADRAERREKDLAALARAGFGYGVAQTVIDADGPDELP